MGECLFCLPRKRNLDIKISSAYQICVYIYIYMYLYIYVCIHMSILTWCLGRCMVCSRSGRQYVRYHLDFALGDTSQEKTRCSVISGGRPSPNTSASSNMKSQWPTWRFQGQSEMTFETLKHFDPAINQLLVVIDWRWTYGALCYNMLQPLVAGILVARLHSLRCMARSRLVIHLGLQGKHQKGQIFGLSSPQ